MKLLPTSMITLVVLYIAVSSSTFIINEYQQALLLQFGKPVGGPIRDAGLHFKLPIVQVVKYFDKRILEWDGEPNQVPTKDKKYIRIDTTARWQIVDVLKFYQTVRNETGAQSRLDDVIDGETRNAIAKYNLVESVRNSNDIMEKQVDSKATTVLGKQTETKIEAIAYGREHLSQEIFNKANKTVKQYGIELIDIKIKRVNYESTVRQKVYERMISERTRIAQQFKSTGLGAKSEILGKMDRELKRIESEAYRKAEEIKGSADAKAAKIYADAYNNNHEFYTFLKTLETAKSLIRKDTTLFLSTDASYLKLLKKMEP